MQKRYLGNARAKYRITFNGKARLVHLLPRVAAYLTRHGRELDDAMDCASKSMTLPQALSNSPSKPTVKARLSGANDRMADLIKEHSAALKAKDEEHAAALKTKDGKIKTLKKELARFRRQVSSKTTKEQGET